MGKNLLKILKNFQSYPEFSSIKKFSIEEDWDLESDVMHSHQRCMADDRKDKDYGNRLINEYLERNFNTPKDFENYVYTVQALQAKGVKKAVETHRRNRTDNYCMGTMYWQIDDCWPVASWSSIDYYGKWKALHYQVKKAYNQVLATHLEKDNKLGIYVVSDELRPISEAEISVQVLDFNGKEIWSKKQNTTIQPNTSQEYLSLDLKEIMNTQKRKSVYVKTVVTANNEVLSENRHFFDFDKNLDLPKAKINYSSKKVADGYELTLSAETFAKYVLISLDKDDAFIADNYFDLDANLPVTIKIETNAEIKDLEKMIRVTSLTDSFVNSLSKKM